MAIGKGNTESSGSRGPQSKSGRWGKRDVVKYESNRQRRKDDKKETAKQVKEMNDGVTK